MLEIVSIVGARPQFIKLAPIARALAKHDTVSHRLIHTGQHYDVQMSAVFFDELELPHPDLNLEIGSASHGVQTGAMLSKLEAAFESPRPHAVLVYGDTNSTLAATLAAAKIHIPVAHIEAGLRSFDRSMPEELNRLVADHCADRLYAPTPAAMRNLERENLSSRAIQTGDVMLDAVLHNRGLAEDKSRIVESLQLTPGRYLLLTVHRASNTTREVLERILAAVSELASESLPVVFPAHPRTRPLAEELGYKASPAFKIVEPAAYLDMLRLIQEASVVLTDSGGVQKEAAFLETPCITLRRETEWVETVELGVNRLVGQDAAAIRAAVEQSTEGESLFNPTVREQMRRSFGSGDAAESIVGDLLHWCNAESGAN